MNLRPRRVHVAILLLVLVQLYSLATGFAAFSRLTLILAAALVSAYAWSRFGLRGIGVFVEWSSARARVGDPLSGWLEVVNHSRFPKPFLEVRDLTTIPELHPGRVISLEPHGVQGWRTQVVARQRGVFHVGPVEVTSRDPFGLFRRSRRFSERQEVLIYPASDPLPGFQPMMLGVPGDGSRPRPSLQPTPSVSHVREYLPGDSLGRIHWPTTARSGRLMVKQFDHEVGNDLWLLLDLDAARQVGHGDDGTEEHAVHAAASVAERALSLGVPVGLIASGAEPYYFAADRGPAQMGRILDALARVRSGGDLSLGATLESGQVRLRRGNLMVITASMDPAWVWSLGRLLRAPGQVVAALLDPSSFGGEEPVEPMAAILADAGVHSYVLRRGVPLAESFANQGPTAIAAWRAGDGNGRGGDS